ncbi:MAG: nicotinate-nucleotide--dimethylbenzimidazole phosphoribosyltransferase, partial [Actinobacteria bacterium]|nr:nicotinate-nucleotide--dimethylbenzimidazole phosphoribosyltransferase [Actinomycetota bacterium]
ADDEIDSGGDLLLIGNLGVGSTAAAAALVSTITAAEPVKTVGRGGRPIDDARWMNKVVAVRDARRRAWSTRTDPAAMIRTAGGADIAAMVGFLLRAAARRTPVIVDGVVAAAAALLAAQVSPLARQWWRLAQLSGEPSLEIVADRLGAPPVATLGLALGDGTGAVLATSVLRAVIALARAQPGTASAHV